VVPALVALNVAPLRLGIKGHTIAAKACGRRRSVSNPFQATPRCAALSRVAWLTLAGAGDSVVPGAVDEARALRHTGQVAGHTHAGRGAARRHRRPVGIVEARLRRAKDF
jgi:hypothetical protein